MKKVSLIGLMVVIQVSFLLQTELSANVVKLVASGMQKAAKHLFSKAGVADLGLAYTLGMGLTAAHEFGHAVTAKAFFGCPIDITLGGQSQEASKKISLLPGVSLAGWNPATGYAWFGDAERTNSFKDRLKEAVMHVAGPLCGAIASAVSFVLLQKYMPHLHLAKAVSLYGLFNQTIGIAGIGGHLLRVPNHDITKAIAVLKDPGSNDSPSNDADNK